MNGIDFKIAQAGMRVFALIYEHKHGTDVIAFRSILSLKKLQEQESRVANLLRVYPGSPWENIVIVQLKEVEELPQVNF